MAPRRKPRAYSDLTPEEKAKLPPPAEIRIGTLADLTPDPKNARRHSERGIGMIEWSLQNHGAARSIVVDEAGMVLAGNGTMEAAALAGIERVLFVPVDGNTLVAVQRTDLNPTQKTELALADNRTTEMSTWEAENLTAIVEADQAIDISRLFTDAEYSALITSQLEEEPPAPPSPPESSGDGLSVSLKFEDAAAKELFLQACDQLANELPDHSSLEDRLQYVLDQFLAS